MSLLVLFHHPVVGTKCDKTKATKRNNIQYYRRNFLFVKQNQGNFGVSIGQLGSSVSTRNAGTTKCPWLWKENVDRLRKPRALAVAECKTCSKTNCRQINYTHVVLVEECDQTTGEKVWIWKQQTLPIGFVYIG